MATGESPQDATGRRLLRAVERIVDDSDELIARVEAMKRRTAAHPGGRQLQRVEARIIARYSNRAALAGGMTALFALLPGVGTAVAVVGGTLADLVLTLKCEVEMALCLSYLHGHDIRDVAERRRAFLLASLSTDEAASGVDLGLAQPEAVWSYAPRQTTKSLVLVMGKLALRRAPRGLLKAAPIVGAVVSASANKVLTASVGRRCARALTRRRALLGEPGAEESIVDARIDSAYASVDAEVVRK